MCLVNRKEYRSVCQKQCSLVLGLWCMGDWKRSECVEVKYSTARRLQPTMFISWMWALWRTNLPSHTHSFYSPHNLNWMSSHHVTQIKMQNQFYICELLGCFFWGGGEGGLDLVYWNGAHINATHSTHAVPLPTRTTNSNNLGVIGHVLHKRT